MVCSGDWRTLVHMPRKRDELNEPTKVNAPFEEALAAMLQRSRAAATRRAVHRTTRCLRLANRWTRPANSASGAQSPFFFQTVQFIDEHDQSSIGRPLPQQVREAAHLTEITSL